MIFKDMSQSDSGGIADNYMNILKNDKIDTIEQIEKAISENVMHENYKSLISRIESFNGKLKVFVPWVAVENKNTYKNWFD